MVLGRGLRVPDVASTSISSELAGSQRTNDGVAIDQLATGRVEEIRAALRLGEHIVVEEVFGRGVERHLEIYDIHRLHQGLRIRIAGPYSARASKADQDRARPLKPYRGCHIYRLGGVSSR